MVNEMPPTWPVQTSSCQTLKRIEATHKEHISAALDDQHGSEHAMFTMGTGTTRGGLIIDPKLQEFIGQHLSREYQLQKERRKAREERMLARMSATGGKNDDSTKE